MNLDVISNNLANVNTTGFKKSKVEFQELLYQTTRAPALTSAPATSCPPASKWARARGRRHRPHFHQRRSHPDRRTARRRRPRQRLFSSANARRHQRLHPRRRVQDDSTGRIVTSDGCPSSADFSPCPPAHQHHHRLQRQRHLHGRERRYDVSGATRPLQQPAGLESEAAIFTRNLPHPAHPNSARLARTVTGRSTRVTSNCPT